VKRYAAGRSFEASGTHVLRGRWLLLALVVCCLSGTTACSAFAAEKGVVRFMGISASGSKGGQLSTPRGVAINEATGVTYVAESANNRVSAFDSTGAFLRAWGMNVVESGPDNNGTTNFEICLPADVCRGGATSPQTGGAMSSPQGVAVNQSTGNVYVADQNNRRIQMFDAAGNFLAAFGWDVKVGGVATFEICSVATECKAAAPGNAGAGQFGTTMSGLAVGPGGAVLVADTSNSRVQRFDSTGNFVSAFGWNVDPSGGSGQLEVCTVTCQKGVAGSGTGQFAASQPSRVAVDSAGSIYTVESSTNNRVQKFTPGGTAASTLAPSALSGVPAPTEVAVDQVNDHVFVVRACNNLCPDAVVGSERRVYEFDNAGNLIGTDAVNNGLTNVNGIAVRHSTGEIFLSSTFEGHRIYVLNTAVPPVAVMDPVTSFGGTTATFEGQINPTGLPVDYHFEFSRDGVTWMRTPVSDVSLGFADESTHPVAKPVSGLTGSQLYSVRLVAKKRFLLGTATAASATSSETTFTTSSAAPAIFGTVASQVTDAGANLNAELNPQNEETTYHFEYGTSDCSLGQCASLPAKALDAGDGLIPVVQGLTALQPNTVYHFRLIAKNSAGETIGPDRTFTTLVTGFPLPEGRAYELVSPPDINGHFLFVQNLADDNFNAPLATASGDAVLFESIGALPGTESNGSADTYKAVRGQHGWSTEEVAPSGVESFGPLRGGTSADLDYSFWVVSQTGGTLDPGTGFPTHHLRRPDGGFEPIGLGSLNEDPAALGRWISPGAGHVVFSTESGASIQLEPEAPPDGVGAVYDRSPGGPTHVVSLLPGDATPSADAFYQGTSENGASVAFSVEGTLFVRSNNTKTHEVASGAPLYDGLSANGDRIFYTAGVSPPFKTGEIFVYDLSSETTIPIGSGTEATVVNVSADGSHVYFMSHAELLPGEGEPGAFNLYVWDGKSVRFIATVDPLDFKSFEGSPLVSLNNWDKAIGTEQGALWGRGSSPSRTNPDGSVFVFQSQGVAGYPYDSQGHSEVYRYTAADGVVCVSCGPVGSEAKSEARLQALGNIKNAPTNAVSVVNNLTDDGRSIFFESAEPLVHDDSDGEVDVYQWREGQVFLISGPHSTGPDFLYAVTPDGHDVFFKTSDALLPQDRSGGAGSIYDARIDGGFPVAADNSVEPCSEGSCQGNGTPPPALSTPGSFSFQGPADPAPRPRKAHKKKHPHKKCHHKKKHRVAGGKARCRAGNRSGGAK
jgi:DNA-binding beta-propeller fold protein YncE